MREELDLKLCSDFPMLYKDRNADMTETCMCWGFPGDGWEPLIRDLSWAITEHVNNENQRIDYRNAHNNSSNPPEERVECHCDQAKEKFGSLRFYVDFNDDYIDGAIRVAELASERTCEVCGAVGTMNNSGWIQCLCDEHRGRL
jgi:hypothetical protein